MFIERGFQQQRLFKQVVGMIVIFVLSHPGYYLTKHSRLRL